MKLSSIQAGMSLVGVEPTLIVSVIAAVKISEAALTLVYRLPDGSIKSEEILLFGFVTRTSLSVSAFSKPPWDFLLPRLAS